MTVAARGQHVTSELALLAARSKVWLRPTNAPTREPDRVHRRRVRSWSSRGSTRIRRPDESGGDGCPLDAGRCIAGEDARDARACRRPPHAGGRGGRRAGPASSGAGLGYLGLEPEDVVGVGRQLRPGSPSTTPSAECGRGWVRRSQPRCAACGSRAAETGSTRRRWRADRPVPRWPGILSMTCTRTSIRRARLQSSATPFPWKPLIVKARVEGRRSRVGPGSEAGIGCRPSRVAGDAERTLGMVRAPSASRSGGCREGGAGCVRAS